MIRDVFYSERDKKNYLYLKKKQNPLANSLESLEKPLLRRLAILIKLKAEINLIGKCSVLRGNTKRHGSSCSVGYTLHIPMHKLLHFSLLIKFGLTENTQNRSHSQYINLYFYHALFF